MKKEMKRYYLVEYFGTRETILPSMDEVRDTINEIRKYNNRKSSKFLFGNVSIDSTEQAKIIAGNIKSGVTILGVEGSYSGEGVTA